MRSILWFLAGLMAFSVAYVFVLRPLGRKWIPWFDKFCGMFDPLYGKLFGGSRTMFLARVVSFSGYAIGIHDQVAPVIIELAGAGIGWDQFFSAEVARTISIMNIVLGHAFAKLRTVTDGPVRGEPPPPPADADDVSASGHIDGGGSP